MNAYRGLLRDSRARRLLAGLAVCKPFVFMVIAWSSWKIARRLCHIRARWPVSLL